MKNLPALLAMVSVAWSVSAADPAHVKEVEQWRAKHEADYTKEYVPLAGLFFLKPGNNAAGSAARSEVLLPKRVPASVGRFVYQNNKIRFEPASDSPVTVKGRPVTTPVDLKSDGAEEYDELAIGDITFWVHESGERPAIRLRDPQSDIATSFKGFHWFAIDERYRVVGKFIKDAKPREIRMPLLTGDDDSGTTEGIVEFTWNGAKIRMRPITTRPGRLWFIFRDATAGHETYEAARFLYSDLKPDGTTVLDFN